MSMPRNLRLRATLLLLRSCGMLLLRATLLLLRASCVLLCGATLLLRAVAVSCLNHLNLSLLSYLLRCACII